MIMIFLKPVLQSICVFEASIGTCQTNSWYGFKVVGGGMYCLVHNIEKLKNYGQLAA